MSDFATQIRNFANRTVEKNDQVVRKVALDLFSRIVLRSPVDTGRFRGNWQITLGAPAEGVLAQEDKSGGTVLGRVRAALGSPVGATVIYLTNNLPYARRLEYGWSQQAPNGMVRITLQEFAQVLGAAAGGSSSAPGGVR